MSYDVSIGDESFNYTYNLSRFFHKHITDGELSGFDAIDGLRGAQAASVLSRAFESISHTRRTFRDDADFCQAFNAENGWGSTVGAIIFMARIQSACIANPRRKVNVT